MSAVAVGIDLGTSGVRAAALDASGAVVGQAASALEARRLPAAWWRAARAVLEGLGDLGGVRAIAVDGTSGTLVCVNAAGTPVGPASLYHDRAAAADVARVRDDVPADSAARGATSPLARAWHLRTRPGIARLLHEADWIAGQLCGRFDVTDANNALKTGYDPRTEAWTVGDFPRALLPEVVAPGTVLAPVRAEVAARFGLPAACAVVAGTTDGCASFLATGAEAMGEGVTALGSTMTLKQLVPEPIFAPDYGIYSHRIGGRWLAGGASNGGGAVLARFFDAAALARLSERIDPARGSGLDYVVLPAAGERFPVNDPDLAPRLEPRPADDALFLHGMLEALARSEAAGYRRLEELGAPKLASVRTVGGGAANAAWSALRARILGVALRPAQSEAACVGAARLALLSAAA